MFHNLIDHVASVPCTVRTNVDEDKDLLFNARYLLNILKRLKNKGF